MIDDFDGDIAVLASVFVARWDLYKMPLERARSEAEDEWYETREWFRSDSTSRGSFLWFCEQLNLNPASVHAAIPVSEEGA